MSAANTGHSAQDATVEVRGEQAELADGEAEGVACRAAVVHAEQQLACLEKQVENITAKLEKINEQWQAKLDEAIVMREAAADELDRWQQQLDERAGF